MIVDWRIAYVRHSFLWCIHRSDVLVNPRLSFLHNLLVRTLIVTSTRDSDWKRFRDPITEQDWFWNVVSEAIFRADDEGESDWHRYGCEEGVWWCNERARTWFWEV